MTTSESLAHRGDAEDASEGDELPPISLRLTLQRLVMEAAADRDFAPSHHDPDYARQRGAPTAFVNFDFVAGVFERLLRTYTGPQGFLEHLDFRIDANAVAGSILVAGGTVERIEHVPGQPGTILHVALFQRADEVRTAHGRARVRLLPHDHAIVSASSPRGEREIE